MGLRLLESAVVLGALLAFRWPRFLFVQVPVFVWGAAVNLADWPCPLTTAENALRRRAGQTPYAGSFVAHYLLPERVAHLGGLHLDLAIGIFVLVVNAAVYANLLLRWRRRTPTGL